MKKIHSILPTLAMVSAVLMLMLLPAAALAAPSDAPVDSHPSGGVTAAVATEYDRAVASGPPSSTLPCIPTLGALACYQAYGDRWYVQDTRADGASAEAFWQNYRGGNLYREGICRNSLGNGKWGVCNKNYYENSFIRWAACVYNGSTGEVVRCSGWTSTQPT